MSAVAEQKDSVLSSIKFHHLQMYVDDLRPVTEYKAMEQTLNCFANSCLKTEKGDQYDVSKGRVAWEQLTGNTVDSSKYVSAGQDLVTQLLHGIGWRVVGEHVGTKTRSICVRPVNQYGDQFIVTCKNNEKLSAEKAKHDGENYDHFDAAHLDRFFKAHRGRQGFAVLGFEVGACSLNQVLSRYKRMHPKLLTSGVIHEYPSDGFRVLEVFAYYKGDKQVSDAEQGTVIRFLELDRSVNTKNVVLPGVRPIEVTYDNTCMSAYCDHWVSNVISREGFLDTLSDTLGFTPKVEFNAGVVAAGEAQIESTVSGNSAVLVQTADALADQSQVYLPTNNALSSVGHVHWFLEELGQGIQHVASRVENLPAFIQRANDYREMTGEGFVFLNIPRSYYGRFEIGNLKALGLSSDVAKTIMNSLVSKELMDLTGIVKLDITDDEIFEALLCIETDRTELVEKIIGTVKQSRYVNLFKLLKGHLDEASYLKIVRNNILVDIQGGDLLYQIFTSTVMQRNSGEEAPFIEFIQRLCSEKKNEDGSYKSIKPGCGGFGIRNFLTLFLSIEVSKAMRELATAKANGDTNAEAKATRIIAVYTAQMDDSNPILTMISDAMTLEGEFLEAAGNTENAADKAGLEAKAAEQRNIKEHGQDLLRECSKKYSAKMKALRST